MDNRNVLELLTERYTALPRSGKKLADYVLANKMDAQYMSITSLAEICGVSEASVTRFCRLLGLDGYNDFKLALAKADNSSAVSAPPGLEEGLIESDSFMGMCQKLYSVDVTALNETMALLDETSAYRAVELFAAARHVYCFGQGGSMVMAMEAWARFSTTTNKFLHIQDSHMQAMMASQCSEEDVILFFSYSGSTRDMLDVLSPARQNGAKVVLVTHFAKSPAAAMADVVLLCGSNESPLQSGSVAAKIGQLFIIDYLYYGYCRSNPDQSAAARDATSRAVSAKLL